eukprot:TRINITY_DN37864_c0_g1_i15.p1 TRINITY_DN37864_c0_g1~~TRINITY_DN37864_c0_g1_i15.p1  ORF type:complete len:103 (-),score=10.74 TRINITY_DN37864_c0_g1_i15:328-636(-)
MFKVGLLIPSLVLALSVPTWHQVSFLSPHVLPGFPSELAAGDFLFLLLLFTPFSSRQQSRGDVLASVAREELPEELCIRDPCAGNSLSLSLFHSASNCSCGS